MELAFHGLGFSFVVFHPEAALLPTSDSHRGTIDGGPPVTPLHSKVSPSPAFLRRTAAPSL